MIYKHTIFVPSSMQTTEYILSPCIICGSDDIKISEYDDEYGYISKVSCKTKGCENEEKENTRLPFCIEKWNQKNDIQAVIEAKKLSIIAAKEDIQYLTKLKKERAKK